MAEELEEKESESFNLEKYLGIARRRHFHFLVPLFLAWSVVWGASWVLSPRYQSSTLILVEHPTMPKDYVTPNVNDNLQDRLQSITQQILSRTRLLHIIDQFGLYGLKHGDRSADQKVELMRKDIAIDLVRDAQERITSFNVSYVNGNPRIAQQVTTELTNLFIDENLEVRQQLSEGTTKFLEGQLETARESLAEQEAKVRQFKSEYVGQMPEQLASNLQILSGLQSQLQNEQDALNAAKQQHVYLQTMADQYRAMKAPSSGTGAAAVGLPALDQQLEKLRAQLADLTSHYTDRHPDVRKLKEQIAETESMREQVIASLKNKAADDPKSGGENDGPAPGADPTQPSMLAQIQSQLRSNQTEITNREHSVAGLQAKIDDYQMRLNQEPIREQQLADLMRGYDQSKANYDDLLKKKNESAMATSMELLQKGERFRIMDPPSFPQKPQFPNRLKFCGMGLGIGLALGFAVVGAFEFMDRRIYDEKELKGLLPVAVLAEIPQVISPADERRSRGRMWLAWVSALFVVGCILVGSALSYLRG